jgi:hypothetical protein
MHRAVVHLRPLSHPEVPYLPMICLSPYGSRRSPPLATPVRSERGAFVLAIRQKGSDSSCHHSIQSRVMKKSKPATVILPFASIYAIFLASALKSAKFAGIAVAPAFLSSSG